ncbi:MAG: 2-amino-4-hydroxy-6-hydroxymethyldihydropteridine diphosphokinase [Candidatus Aminicenantes bacterium]|nr:2-amino-4-hydroxy-6-hydroxymethyldihydropteridine diphosphokinase [Candidatus Aminicenantes bacterium]
MRYYLSLGSNLGDRSRHLSEARGLLQKAGVKIIKESSIYETEPVDFTDQPWFYNQVLEVETRLNPMAMLALVKDIELKMKRVPSVDKGPRTIDIDILLAEKNVVQTQKLIIPHPRLSLRNFVMIPLAEIAPDFIHPLLHQPISALVQQTGDQAEVRKVVEPSTAQMAI